MAFSPFASRIAQYLTALPTLTNNDVAPLQVDVNGRLIVATSGNSLAIDDSGGSITVDGTVTADAGTGPWPVTDNGGSLTVDNPTLSVVGGGVEATALRVTIANDSTGLVSVDDGGGSLTVDGTVAVSSVAGTVAVTQSTSPWVVSNGGTFAVQEDGAALTALQLIDNLVLLEDAAAVGGEAGVQMLAVRQDTLAGSTSADGDFASLKVNALGELYVTGSLTANVDDVFESGTEADTASDSAGDGIVAITGSMTNLATLAVGAGVTAYITGLDISADQQIGWDLIVDDNGTPSEWIRVGGLQGLTSHNKTFPRAIEITGALNRSVILRAQRLGGTTGNAGGGINAYTR